MAAVGRLESGWQVCQVGLFLPGDAVFCQRQVFLNLHDPVFGHLGINCRGRLFRKDGLTASFRLGRIDLRQAGKRDFHQCSGDPDSRERA